MDTLTILLIASLVVALVVAAILAFGLTDALKRIERLDDNNARLFDQNMKLRKENIGRRRKGADLAVQIADLTAKRDDLQAELDEAYRQLESTRALAEKGKAVDRPFGRVSNHFTAPAIDIALDGSTYFGPLSSRRISDPGSIRELFTGRPDDPAALRQERAAALTEAREERQKSQELRVLLAAVLGLDGYVSLSARQLRHAERRHKLRYQKDGNTGVVTLRVVPAEATENVGKFL